MKAGNTVSCPWESRTLPNRQTSMDIRSIAVLGDGDAPDWSRDEKGLHIKTGFRSAHSVVFKIKVD